MSYMNVPIRFWGRVVDQDGAPLAGVKVAVGVRTWKTIPIGVPWGVDSSRLRLTGADGRFEVSGVDGDVLGIDSLALPGYEAEPGACRGFGYTPPRPFIPDRSSPELFRMWNTNLRAKLISGSRRWGLIPDGRVYTLDLKEGACSDKQAPTGDMRVSVQRSTNAVWGKHFDWSLLVQGVDGGFLEETNDYCAMFQAPAAGYTNEIRASAKSGDARWTDGLPGRRFYLRSRSGEFYRRIEIETYSLYLLDGQARLNLTYALNAEGGRLLR